jgi:hypothetical protein
MIYKLIDKLIYLIKILKQMFNLNVLQKLLKSNKNKNINLRMLLTINK